LTLAVFSDQGNYYPSKYLGQFDINYIIFRIVEIFKKLFLQNQKNIVKDNTDFLKIPFVDNNENFKIN
jgi:hypothetical protein